MKYLNKNELAIGLGLIIAVIIGSFGVFAKESEEVRSNILRLHILANSDSDEDQALKLKVRDKILDQTGDMFVETTSLDSAEQTVQEQIGDIQKIAEETVAEEGYDYPIHVEFTNMFFNTRTYESVTLPAGRYDALRVTIGEAEGKNWWCVLYPPMCVPAAQPKQEIEDVLNEEESDLVQSDPKYEVRFAVVEMYESIKEQFQ